MKKIIDITNWNRKENFEFFKNFYNPFISVTCHVPCKKAKLQSSYKNESFFLYYLYAILYAVNQIDELKYRIDLSGNIVKHDKIDALTPIKKSCMNSFTTVRIPFEINKTLFVEQAREIIKKSNNSNSYSEEINCQDFDVVLISAIPNLAFTSITCTQKHGKGNDYPLINIGKLDNEYNLPIAISVHHGFADGEHIAKFYDLVQNLLNVNLQ